LRAALHLRQTPDHALRHEVAPGPPRPRGAARAQGFEGRNRHSAVAGAGHQVRAAAVGGGRQLLQLEAPGCCNYLYRMKALDAIRTSEIPFHADGRYPKSLIGKNFCAYLLELRNSSGSFKGVRKALIDALLDGYESARYGTGVFGKPEYLKYQEALNELANVIQVTYLPSSQKSKRAKHFLELKSFKDNYNTLESTL
ncbi:hypothetical protein A306_00014071, partial [Columba livia]